jgi:hypothetical protein
VLRPVAHSDQAMPSWMVELAALSCEVPHLLCSPFFSFHSRFPTLFTVFDAVKKDQVFIPSKKYSSSRDQDIHHVLGLDAQVA